METFLAMMSRASHAWLAWMWPMAWQVALMGLAVLGVALLARKASPRFRYFLWCLLLLKLCLPPSLAFVTGAGQWVLPKQAAAVSWAVPRSTAAAAPSPEGVAEPVRLASRPEPAPAVFVPQAITPAAAPAARAAFHLPWPTALFGIWCLGVLALVFLFLAQHRRMGRLLAAARPVHDESVLRLLEEARAALGISSRVALVSVENLHSPILFGVLRPRIAIPRPALESLPPEQIRPILLHELAHLRRKDLWVSFVQLLVQVLYWFHPAVWLANRQLRRERELIVDDIVLAQLPGQRESYSASLLSIVKQGAQRQFFTPAYVGIVETTGTLAVRLKRVLDTNRKLSLRLGWAGIILLLALGLVLIPQAHSQTKKENPAAQAKQDLPAPPAQPQAAVLIKGTLLDDQGRPVAGARLTAVLTSEDAPLDPFKPDIDVTTDAEGRFEARAKEGDYFVLGRKELLTSDGGPWEERQWHVVAGKPMDHFTLHLKSGGRVTGTVTNKDTGAPIADAGVVAESGHTTATDAQGRFELVGLALGEHTLEVISPGRANTHQAINTTGKPDYDVKIELARGFVVRGRVTDEAGKPVAGALVGDNYSGSIIQCWMQRCLTDTDGRYELKSYPFTRKLWSMSVNHKDFASVTKGDLDPPAQGDVLTVDFTLGQGFAVDGDVRDEAGKPVKGALVSYSPDQAYVLYQDTRTDENGHFRLARISEAREDSICVLAKGFAPADQRATPGKGDQVPHLDFTLTPGHNASGRVVDAAGKPVAGATIVAARPVSRQPRGSYFGPRIDTDAEGRFKFDSLPAQGVTADVWKQGYSAVRQTPITVDGETEIRMDPAGVIKGRVVDETTGQPVTSFNVRLGISRNTVEGRPFGSFAAYLSGRGQDCRADDGCFTIEELTCRAAHVVIVTAPGYAETRLEEVIARPEDSPDWPLAIKLGKGVAYTGTVTEVGTGKPIAGADVLLIRSSDPLRQVPLRVFEERDRYIFSADLAQSDSEGRFEFRMPASERRAFSLLLRHKEYAPALLQDIPRDAPAAVALSKGATVLCKAQGVPGFVEDQWRVEVIVGSLQIEGSRFGKDGTAIISDVPAGADRDIRLLSRQGVENVARIALQPGQMVEVDFAHSPGTKLTGANKMEFSKGVTFQGTVTYADTGKPASGVTVKFAYMEHPDITTRTDAQGGFKIVWPREGSEGSLILLAQSDGEPAEWFGAVHVRKEKFMFGDRFEDLHILLKKSQAARLAEWRRVPGIARETACSVAVLDDADPVFSGKTHYDDTLSAYGADGKMIWQLTGFNICEDIGGSHELVWNARDKSLWVTENVANTLRKFSRDGKALWEKKDAKAGAMSADPKTGGVRALSSGGSVDIGPDGTLGARVNADGYDMAYSAADDCFWLVGKKVLKVSRKGEVLYESPKPFAWYAVSVAVNDEDGSVWVLEREHSQVYGSRDYVHILNRDGSERGGFPVPVEYGGVFCLALDASGNAAWVAGSEGVRKFSATGEILCSAPLKANSLAVEPDTGYVWAAGPDGVFRLDAEARYVCGWSGPRASFKRICVIPPG
jgi:beta-lactamase regulating signal transducer with metallopeptidase domain/protocatechuate 3,4-dioxygenase beta subunit